MRLMSASSLWVWLLPTSPRRAPHLLKWMKHCTLNIGYSLVLTSTDTALYPLLVSRAKDLPKLSSLGHFLKGSSAALGVSKVQASCERMQHYGQKRDEQAGINLSSEDALDKIERLLVQVKKEYRDAEAWLKQWYGIESDDMPAGRED